MGAWPNRRDQPRRIPPVAGSKSLRERALRSGAAVVGEPVGSRRVVVALAALCVDLDGDRDRLLRTAGRKVLGGLEHLWVGQSSAADSGRMSQRAAALFHHGRAHDPVRPVFVHRRGPPELVAGELLHLRGAGPRRGWPPARLSKEAMVSGARFEYPQSAKTSPASTPCAYALRSASSRSSV